MVRIRSFYDADREDKLNVPTFYKTEQNKYELICSDCGKSVFVNDLIFQDVTKIVEKTMENPFYCPECIEQYEEAAYQH